MILQMTSIVMRLAIKDREKMLIVFLHPFKLFSKSYNFIQLVTIVKSIK